MERCHVSFRPRFGSALRLLGTSRENHLTATTVQRLSLESVLIQLVHKISVRAEKKVEGELNAGVPAGAG
jgi:hypothetical protein